MLPTENRELVADEFTAKTGEDGRTADQARSLLLAPVGREPSDAAAVCQYVGADRGVVATGGIARAVAVKKNSSAIPQNGELSQKGGSGSRANGLWGLEKGGWKPVGPSGRKSCARRARLLVTECILATAGEPKSLFRIIGASYACHRSGPGSRGILHVRECCRSLDPECRIGSSRPGQPPTTAVCHDIPVRFGASRARYYHLLVLGGRRSPKGKRRTSCFRPHPSPSLSTSLMVDRSPLFRMLARSPSGAARS